MATVHHCDRCERPGQLVTVLGKDLCNDCIHDVRDFISRAPVKSVRRSGSRLTPKQFREEAFKKLRTRGYACSREIAAEFGVDYRHVYYALLHMANRGELRNAGSSRFVAAEAAKESA